MFIFFAEMAKLVDATGLSPVGEIHKSSSLFFRIHRSVSRQSYKLCGIIRVMVHVGSSPITPKKSVGKVLVLPLKQTDGYIRYEVYFMLKPFSNNKERKTSVVND